MSEVLEIAKEIKAKIRQLEDGRNFLQRAAELKAESSAKYEKEVAKWLIRLKNGEEVTFEGHTVKNPPTTIVYHIVKGLCWELALDRDKNESLYKSTVEKLECLRAELNGWQSINRFLSET